MILHWNIFISAIVSATAAAVQLENLFEHDPCGKDGICKKAKDCPAVSELVKSGQKPELCGFDENTPIFCCPITNVDYKSEESISAKMCNEYRQSICPGYVENISDGVLVNPKELPFMALIGYGSNKDKIEWQCGGTLISKRYILSAAHCTSLSTLGKPRWVRLGELDLSDTSEDARPQDFRITEHFNHPEYNSTVNYNDIALYQLDRDVEFDQYVRPICLNQVIINGAITEATASGWGRVGLVEAKSPKLLKVNLDVFALDRCSDLVNSIQLPKGLTDDMICAGKIEGGKDTCQGDSGGPLFLPATKKQTDELCYLLTQIGITSFGKQCGLAGVPAVYTNIVSYLPWLEQIVWPQNVSSQSIWN